MIRGPQPDRRQARLRIALAAIIAAATVTSADAQTIPTRLTVAGIDVPDAEVVERVEELWRAILGPQKGRHAARQALAAVGPSAIPVVLGHADAASFGERWEVVNSLGTIGDPRAADPLVVMIVTDANLHVRWRGMWALQAVGNPQSPDMLRAWLQADSAKHRWNAAVALAFFKQSDALPYLEEGLSSVDSWERWEAVNGLGQVHDADTAALLFPMLDVKDAGLRREAVMSLGRIGDEAALAKLEELVSHDDPEIRWRAAMALRLNDAKGAVDSLRAQLAVETDANCRKELKRSVDKLSGTAPVRTREAKPKPRATPKPARATRAATRPKPAATAPAARRTHKRSSDDYP